MNSVDQSRSLRWEAGLAYAKGLTATEAVAAMTTIPAQIFGVGSVVGEITTGYAGPDSARARRGGGCGCTGRSGSGRG